MKYSDEELIAISALQHFLYCPRQCALIHLEQVWAENFFTADGRQMHDRVHEEGDEHRPGIVIERGMPICSLKFGITGKTDVVEYHSDGAIVPVEYKRGKPKSGMLDEIQLCAQALCLEEMKGGSIEKGYLYYGRPRRRTEVVFDSVLREAVEDTVVRLREMLKSGKTPEPEWDKKRCSACSLVELCSPQMMSKKFTIDTYLKKSIARI